MEDKRDPIATKSWELRARSRQLIHDARQLLEQSREYEMKLKELRARYARLSTQLGEEGPQKKIRQGPHRSIFSP